jgi:hypothetical protein
VSEFGEALVAWMLEDGILTTLIGTRLYPNIIPQDAERPAIAYQLIDAQHVASRSGSSHLARSLVQFTCDAESYAEVKALATAVRNCWDGVQDVISDVWLQGAVVVNELDEFSEQRATPVVRLDLAIWHSEGINFSGGTTT